jgi:hypothetical protein
MVHSLGLSSDCGYSTYYPAVATGSLRGWFDPDLKHYVIYEGGTWRHKFGREEYDLLVPDPSYQEFVAV